MTTRYQNPWHDGTQNYGPAFYTCADEPKAEYRGFKVFHRSGGFDYVFADCCITQRAGMSKYKDVIDGLIKGSEHGAPILKKVITETGKKPS